MYVCVCLEMVCVEVVSMCVGVLVVRVWVGGCVCVCVRESDALRPSQSLTGRGISL